MKTDFEIYDEEWLAVVAETLNWSAKTRETNASILRRLHGYNALDRPVLDASEQALLDLVRKVENPNTRVCAIAVLTGMRNCAERPVSLLGKHRRKLIREDIPKLRRTTNLAHEPRTYDQLWAEITHAGTNDSQKAIVLCMIAALGCRIEDLNAVVTSDKAVAEAEEGNVVLIRTKDVMVYRRRYKTAAVYGPRTDKIDGALGKILRKALVAGKFEGGRLIRQARGGDTPLNQLSMRVRTVMGGLSARMLFKDWVNAHRLRGDFQRLKDFSETRGTALTTLLTSYDLSVVPIGVPIGESDPEASHP